MTLGTLLCALLDLLELALFSLGAQGTQSDSLSMTKDRNGLFWPSVNMNYSFGTINVSLVYDGVCQCEHL